MDIQTIIQNNKYRGTILEILSFCVSAKKPLTRKTILKQMLVSPAKTDQILYLLESLGLIQEFFVGRTLVIQSTCLVREVFKGEEKANELGLSNH